MMVSGRTINVSVESVLPVRPDLADPAGILPDQCLQRHEAAAPDACPRVRTARFSVTVIDRASPAGPNALPPSRFVDPAYPKGAPPQIEGQESQGNDPGLGLERLQPLPDPADSDEKGASGPQI
jgi:hypothetical protein